MADTSDWFSGDSPRTSLEAAFLDEVRADRWEWGLSGLSPSDTSVMTAVVPLLVVIDVPWVPSGIRSLQVGYWAAADVDSVALRAEWGDGHLLDNGGIADDLQVGGLALSPVEAAQLSSRWLLAQLHRPVDRQDWVDRSGHRIAARWRLADSGRVLANEGSRLTRRLREPSTITRVPRAAS